MTEDDGGGGGGGGGCDGNVMTAAGSSFNFFGCDSCGAIQSDGAPLPLDDDGSAYRLGDGARTVTITAAADGCSIAAFGGGGGGSDGCGGGGGGGGDDGVCSLCGGCTSESFLYWDALRSLIFTLRNSLVSTSIDSSSGFGVFDFLLKTTRIHKM